MRRVRCSNSALLDMSGAVSSAGAASVLLSHLVHLARLSAYLILQLTQHL